MTRAIFRFYAELNGLLAKECRGQERVIGFKGRQTVKHLIESQGVPHTEVGLILAGGQSVGLDYLPQENERISVFPVFQSLDISTLHRLRPEPPCAMRFILDGHLGRLAAYLRMVGFDALYRNDYQDEELVDISVQDQRIVLTRDRGLLKRSRVTHAFLVKTRDPWQQLLSVVQRFDLTEKLNPFSRCMACNGLLEAVEKREVAEILEPKTKKYFEEFGRCASCGKVYWAGSHHRKMTELIARLSEALND